MKKYACFAIMIVSFYSLLGCAELTKKSTQSQDERLSLIDQKIREIEQGLSNQNTASQDIGRRIEDLSQKTAGIDANYVKLNVSFEELDAKVDKKDASLETVLSQTQKTTSELEERLREVEKMRADLQNQLASLRAQKAHLDEPKVAQQSEPVKEAAKGPMEQEVAKDVPIDKKPEGSKLAEALTTGQEKEVLQKLLDEALVFYRDGKYQEAIAKWEEVLVMYPDNLEAKFNIEIAKEKVKSLPVK